MVAPDVAIVRHVAASRVMGLWRVLAGRCCGGGVVVLGGGGSRVRTWSGPMGSDCVSGGLLPAFLALWGLPLCGSPALMPRRVRVGGGPFLLAVPLCGLVGSALGRRRLGSFGLAGLVALVACWLSVFGLGGCFPVMRLRAG